MLADADTRVEADCALRIVQAVGLESDGTVAIGGPATPYTWLISYNCDDKQEQVSVVYEESTEPTITRAPPIDGTRFETVPTVDSPAIVEAYSSGNCGSIAGPPGQWSLQLAPTNGVQASEGELLATIQGPSGGWQGVFAGPEFVQELVACPMP